MPVEEMRARRRCSSDSARACARFASMTRSPTASRISARSASRSAAASDPSSMAPCSRGDADVDLVVGAVHTARVVDRVGEDAAAVERVFDAAELGEAEVAALADDAAARLVAVDADAVAGPVAASACVSAEGFT